MLHHGALLSLHQPIVAWFWTYSEGSPSLPTVQSTWTLKGGPLAAPSSPLWSSEISYSSALTRYVPLFSFNGRYCHRRVFTLGEMKLILIIKKTVPLDEDAVDRVLKARGGGGGRIQ